MRKLSLGLFVALVASLAIGSTASAAPFVFTNGSSIPVPDNASLDPESTLSVNAPGLISRVEVRIKTVTHTRPADLDIMVETPSGDFFYLMSDQCGATGVTGYDWYFADDYTDQLGTSTASCGSVNVKPGDNFADTDGWDTAPGAVPATTFASLTGTNQNGTWRLHIDDDTASETGTIGNGWEVRIESTTPDAVRIPTTGDSGTAAPITKTLGGFTRTISDVDVVLNDLTHTHFNDLDIALQSPAGTVALFASDGCGAPDRNNEFWTFDDEAVDAYPEGAGPACDSVNRFIPRNNPEIETNIGTVFTGGPFATALSAFDGQSANGDWKLVVQDDSAGDFGWINGFDLAITMRGAKVVAPSNPKLFFKKLGRKSIRTTGRVSLSGESLAANECAGSVKSTFQVKVVRKKGRKRVTSYKKVVAVNSTITQAAGGTCGYDISAKIPKAYSGKRLRLVTTYLGGEFIAPFTGTTTEKIKKIKF